MVLCIVMAVYAVLAEHPKYIAFAWEFTGNTPQALVKLADKLDKTPLDGIGVKLKAKTEINGVMTNLNHKYIMQGPAWPKSAFKNQIPHFRKLTKHKSMQHSLVSSFSCPKVRIPWDDDAKWALVANNMRTAAWVAREGGFKGVYADPEDYRKVMQFTRLPDDPPYDELCEIARRRGREVFTPIFEEYPEAKVHFFWFMSHVKFYLKRDGNDPQRMVRMDESLWPSFVNGILDVLPPGASINDGEETAYYYSAAYLGYRNGSHMFHTVYPKLVAPENLEKYRRQVSYAPAIYMDMFTNKKGAKWYKGPTDGSRTETFRRDLAQATEVSGGYVWFWGEMHTWADRGKKWRKPDGRIKDTTWQDELPGLFRAMEWVKNPAELYDREIAVLESKGALTNCYTLGDVVVRKDNAGVTAKPFRDYERYGIWNYFVTNSVPAVGGAYYGVAYDVKGTGARFNVFFQDAGGTNLAPTINFVYPDIRRGVVRAPNGSVRATFVFGAKNRPDEETIYSNIKFYKLEDAK